MSAEHLNEVEKTLLYITEARERASRARALLKLEGGEPHLIEALRKTEDVLAQEHRLLMQRTFFAVGSSDDSQLVH